MRQVCNVSYSLQAAGFADESALLTWDRGLEVEPGSNVTPGVREVVDPGFLAAMGPG